MIDPNSQVTIPARMIPSFNATVSRERSVSDNLMFRTWGGLGDVICAEPTIRYAIENFKKCNVSLTTEHPELFRHLQLRDIFDLKREQPIWERYFTLQNVKPDTDISFEFIAHMLMHCVDYPSICAFRAQLPIKSKTVKLKPTIDQLGKAWSILNEHRFPVVIHAGKHWPTKSLPADWWDQIIAGLQSKGISPILIGSHLDDNRGTVDIDPNGCVDLRNTLSIMESVALVQNCRVLLTNDSAPLHMASSEDGNAWIGYFATAKHYDLITHWRTPKAIWGWRMENLSKGGYWELDDIYPNRETILTAEFIEPSILRSWLPDPSDVVAWTIDKSPGLRNE